MSDEWNMTIKTKLRREKRLKIKRGVLVKGKYKWKQQSQEKRAKRKQVIRSGIEKAKVYRDKLLNENNGDKILEGEKCDLEAYTEIK